MKSPKVVVIGAGSFFFGRPAIWNMIHSEVLRGGTLALVDTDPKVLETMMGVAKKAIAATKAPTTLIGSTDRRKVLKDADFVILTFSRRNAYYRGIDTKISAKHGITLCSADTIGPGGIFRALREIPVALAVARDMEELCPHGWLINFVNPTAAIGIALMRHAKVRSFALCDGHHEPRARKFYLHYVGITPDETSPIPPEVERKVDMAIAGVNHFTWLIRFNYDGKNMLPVWREKLAEYARAEINADTFHDNAKSKSMFNSAYALQLMDVFGCYPDTIGHTKEYVPFFQGYGVTPPKPAKIMPFDAKARMKLMAADFKVNEGYASGKLPISEFLAKGGPDHATDIIENMWGNLRKPFFINSANRGAVTNMPADAFFELRCDIDLSGPRPQPVGALPHGILGLEQLVLDSHEATVEAAVSCDRRLLLRALATDPIVNNLGDARKIMDELLVAEKEVLPPQWQKK